VDNDVQRDQINTTINMASSPTDKRFQTFLVLAIIVLALAVIVLALLVVIVLVKFRA
jgi:heme/copper-type cytochrome/quinol oxidase subunit 2